MRLPTPLRLFLLQTTIWTVLCLGVEAVCRFALHLGYPYNYPAVPIFALFGDFAPWTHKFLFFHTLQFFSNGPETMYPAPALVAYKLFVFGPLVHMRSRVATLLFVTVMLVVSWALLVTFRKALIRRGLAPRSATLFVLGVYLCSFPFWFVIHQANIEFITWMAMLIGIASFWNAKPTTAAICFGIAGAMKIFPLIFVGLFLAKKQYRQIVVSLLVCVFVNVLSLWLLCPDIRFSWMETEKSLADFREIFMLHLLPVQAGFDHSLFCLIKRLFPTLPPPSSLSHVLTLYMAISAIGGVILFFTRIQKLPFTNQVLCLSIAATLLPPTSYDYTLVHLYAPFALLAFVALEHSALQASRKGLGLAFALFAFLLAPQSEFIFHGYRYAAQLKAVALVALWIVALVYPFETEPLVTRTEAFVQPLTDSVSTPLPAIS